MTSRQSAKARRWAVGAVTALSEAAPSTDPAVATVAVVIASLASDGRAVDHLWGTLCADSGVSSSLQDLAIEIVEGGLGRVAPEPVSGWSDPWLVGLVHEQAATVERRSARGAWYTPESVVRGLVSLAAACHGERPAAIVDPTCGGGAFLLAALDHLVSVGVDPDEAVRRVSGTDIDPGAVEAARWSIALWAATYGCVVAPADTAISVADALMTPTTDLPSSRLVVGNPPFASPLRSGAVPEAAERYRSAHAGVLGPYSDLSAIHLFAAVEATGAGSTVAFVQPQSLLASRDAGPLRDYLGDTGSLRALWACREPVFDAGVRACAPVISINRAVNSSPVAESQPSVGSTVTLAAGPAVAVLPTDGVGGRPWSDLAAQALGAPALPEWLEQLPSKGDPGARLGSMVSATAGFRDEFYGLVEACREAADDPSIENRLLTVGLVDPLVDKWGMSNCKFGGAKWDRPVIDLEELSPKVRTWTTRQLVPKLVVATQSRVLEPVIDRQGVCVPATPLLSVVADPWQLDRVAAVLLAPPVTAWAWRRWFGSALAVDALKLAAHQLEQLPLPPDAELWSAAADLIADRGVAAIEEVAELMNRAYGAEPDVLDWWLERYRRLAPPSR